ncbi:MAG: putative PEP-binding protein, partial [Desulfoplanes sp.]
EAVLKAIEIIGKAANKFNIPVSVCGELGAKEEVIPYFLKYGIKSFSMNALQVPNIKKMITQISLENDY